jgi:hypothetical protein
MRRLTAVAALALVLTACGADDEVGGETPTPAGADDAVPPSESVPVREAAVQADGPTTVTGQLLVEGDRMVLCAGLTRSIPPLCVGSRLTVEDLDLDAVELTEAAGVRWTSAPVTLQGEKLGDTLFGASVAG